MGRPSSTLVERLRHRAAPSHWSFVFGVVWVACLVVLIITGVILTLFYSPSSSTVQYQGSYPLLRGTEMSAALASTLHISFDVPGGLLLRQAHHWAALVMPGALLLQILTTFFTGAFRKPRQWGWVLLIMILILTLAAGWSGYALPDDTLSGIGLRIVEGVTLGIPLIGSQLTWLLFGGEFPGKIIPHLYLIHLVASVVLGGLAVARFRLSYRQRPAQFPGPGRTEDNVVGVPVWPTAAVKAAGLFLSTIGVLLLMAATMTITPVWLYGPSSPANGFAGSQPDWYTAFLDGAVRLVPPGWEVVLLGRTWTLAVLVPLVAIGIFFTVLVIYPFLESWVSGDRREHHLLDRPRNAPVRTGIGAAGVTFYGALWGAGSADLISTHFAVSFELVIGTLQIVVLLGPVLAYVVARHACLGLQARDRDRVLHGSESGQIFRLPSGGYVEPHEPVSPAEAWALTRAEAPPPPISEPDGRDRLGPRVRARLQRAYLADRPEPVAAAAVTTGQKVPVGAPERPR